MQRVLGTNVVGAFATIQAFYPLLKVSCSARHVCHRRRSSTLTSASRTARESIAHMDGRGHTGMQHAAAQRRARCRASNPVAAAHAAGRARTRTLAHERPRSRARSWLVSPLTVLSASRLQKKVDGVKAVMTISSLAGVMSASSESARALDKAAGPLDNAVLAYKVSKTALNQGARDEHPECMRVQVEALSGVRCWLPTSWPITHRFRSLAIRVPALVSCVTVESSPLFSVSLVCTAFVIFRATHSKQSAVYAWSSRGL